MGFVLTAETPSGSPSVKGGEKGMYNEGRKTDFALHHYQRVCRVLN